MSNEKKPTNAWGWHRNLLEHRAAMFAVFTTVAISIGGIVEILPMYSVSAGPASMDSVTPYTALEQAGRDLYVREGCYNCHSQMVRPFRSETLRYGPWSRAGEYEYEHPFQLGSRRIGPDLHRVGGKYPDVWHFEHMRDPRSTSPGSIMPTYAWLLDATVDPVDVTASLTALRTVGVPYTDADIAGVAASMQAQGGAIVGRLSGAGIDTQPDTEIVAMIAYLQRLGVDGRAGVAAAAAAAGGSK
jgi:cytochrome c oxidase cbb3-type subunit I/II